MCDGAVESDAAVVPITEEYAAVKRAGRFVATDS
jgi:hypothetical protein